MGKNPTSGMAEQMEISLPETGDEPKPWTVKVWRFHVMTEHPFLSREEAMLYLAGAAEDDGCYAEGVFQPDGQLDEEATEQAKYGYWEGWRAKHG